MNMIKIAIKTQDLCTNFINQNIDSKSFRTGLMTLAFEASGISDEELEVFNSILKSIVRMRQITRKEILGVVKNIKGDVREIVKIIENQTHKKGELK